MLVREAKEEANLDTSPGDWKFIGTLIKPKKWKVHVAFTYIDSNQLQNIPLECDEGSFILTRVTNLPENTMTNIRWLIPLVMGYDKENQKDFVINYHPDDEE